jgi:thiamine-monophosphate kinase
LHAGIAEASERFGLTLIGGDTNVWDGPLVVSVTAIGETAGRGPVLRSGARAGDVIFVTGPLGGSLLGRHLRPVPRVAEALALQAAVPLHAMIDLSDGLASDLQHILEESGGLGAILDESAIPIHPDAEAQSRRDGRSPLDHALADGEDFELCFAVGPDDASRLLSAPAPPSALFRIGEVVEQRGIRLRSPTGSIREMTARGFDHLT